MNSIWEDQKAFKFLMDAKAFDWAAAANIINGDEKAEAALKRAGRIISFGWHMPFRAEFMKTETGRLVRWGVMKNIFDFKKAFKKE